jgi:DNA polymerase-4
LIFPAVVSGFETLLRHHRNERIFDTVHPHSADSNGGGFMELRSLFIDFNAYFASVEQQEQPALRGRPVAVVPVLSRNSCCIAASYEAKKNGVRTGTLVHEAQSLCPGIKLVSARPAVYVRYHHRLVELINQCIPTAYIGSIDEMACELIGRERQRANAEAIARAIKLKLAEHTPYIKASIGIAPNHFLAKTATDMQKPDGLVVLEASDLPHALHGLELRELCGIGRAMEKRLHQQNIFTVAQLCDAPIKRLHSVWGSIEGDRYYRKLRGEFVPEAAPDAKSSISHSHVLPPELRNPASAEAVLKKLLQKAAMRMRAEKLVTRSLQVKIKYLDGPSWRESCHCNDTDDSHVLLNQLNALLATSPRQGRPLAVSVVLWNLCARAGTTDDLFASPEEKEHAPLSTLMDRINERFGFQKITYASSQPAAKAAPMRISFNRIPDVAREDEFIGLLQRQ